MGPLVLTALRHPYVSLVIALCLCSRLGQFAGLREMGFQEGANDITQVLVQQNPANKQAYPGCNSK
eukprot:1501968-Amphidinium_carterae.1